MVDTPTPQPSSGIFRTLAREEQGQYSIDGVDPVYLAEPKDNDEIEEVLSHAKNLSSSVIPRGNGTKLGIGSKPKTLGIVLVTKNLDKLIEHQHENLTFTAEAGMTLSEAQEILSSKAQFIPLDPHHSSKATLGGIAATNSAGPMMMRYGTSRDLIIEMKAVTASGNSIRSGAKVVKNVAGYDLKKLFIGSFGTLGVISELTFRTYPLPESEVTLLAQFESPKDAFAASRAVRDTGPSVTSIELLDDGAFGLITDSYAPTKTTSWTLAIRIDGYASVIEKWSSRISEVCSKNGSRHTDELKGAESKRLWNSINEIEGVPLLDRSVHLNISVPQSTTLQIIDKLSGFRSRRDIDLAVGALPSLGSIHAFFLAKGHSGIDFGNIVEALRLSALELNGNLTVYSAPPEIKETLDVWGPTLPEIRLMKAIKENFDPDGIMTPGRFVGGL
ncbi:MAG: FAD-binding oxidoreductase [Nitrososphaerales archaeon]